MLRRLPTFAQTSFDCLAGARFVKTLRTALQKPLEDTGLPTIAEGRQAFEGDLRSTSALGLGDGLTTHTSKWFSVCPFISTTVVQDWHRAAFVSVLLFRYLNSGMLYK